MNVSQRDEFSSEWNRVLLSRNPFYHDTSYCTINAQLEQRLQQFLIRTYSTSAHLWCESFNNRIIRIITNWRSPWIPWFISYLRVFCLLADETTGITVFLWKEVFLMMALTHCGLMTSYDVAELGQHSSRYWLGTKPLPETLLTYHPKSIVV